jgi:hypothetical protein
MPPDPLREVIALRAFASLEQSLPAQAVARQVAAWGGTSVRAVLFFGSRKTRASPDAWSAFDLFVLTHGYAAFYRSLREAGRLARRPALVAALNRALPPNQISIRAGPEAGEWHAKCAVISLETLLSETSPRRHDHFCLGRLCQPVDVLYVADETARLAVLDALVSACTLTYAWVRPWLPQRFDASAYCQTLLRVSLAQEIRPEPAGRAEALFLAQQHDLIPVYSVLLEQLAARGELLPLTPGTFALARLASRAERIRIRGYFAWSLVRATARWAKYVVTFQGWLEYILRKAQRHSGQQIALTARERRFPLIFLWPRLFRYFRSRDRSLPP